MKKTICLLVLFFAGTNVLCAQTKPARSSGAGEVTIRKAMDEQLAAWNAGDINRFMGTYWQSDSLMFIGKSGITYGWQKTMDNYKKGYPDTAAMGKLDFDIVAIKRLSVLYFFVVGKWHLTRSIGNVQGHFTLLFKKIKNKWVIVADHSS
jgi:ketosteroid isomerase-like protein